MAHRPAFTVRLIAAIGSSCAVAAAAATGPFGLDAPSPESVQCVDCHRRESPGLYQQWGKSRHFGANIGCYECHVTEKTDPDALLHYDQWISVIVSPRDCARCHAAEVQEFRDSRHSRAGHIIGSPDHVLADVVAGDRAMMTPGFPGGNSAAVISGCWRCHGSEVKVLPNGQLDAATWPNTGIGRINPDGSEGSCTACHTRHTFSVAQARHPETCGGCHLGSDHPQKEIYEESKHGMLFFSNVGQMNLDTPKWIVGEDYSVAPTCATCHMSATRHQPVTHDVGLRISWNNRPAVSVRPEVADAGMGLPGAAVPWEVRRENMKDVCLTCHSKPWVDGFYTQYDGLVELYNEKFGRPGQTLYALAGPLLRPVEFGNQLDFIWFEIWHRAGRSARHGAAMMGPDHTHRHGTYEVARRFYNEFVPELERLVNEGLASGIPETIEAAEVLAAALRATLESDRHKWFIGEMDPDQAARRKQAAEAFKKRYGGR